MTTPPFAPRNKHTLKIAAYAAGKHPSTTENAENRPPDDGDANNRPPAKRGQKKGVPAPPLLHERSPDGERVAPDASPTLLSASVDSDTAIQILRAMLALVELFNARPGAIGGNVHIGFDVYVRLP